MHSGLPGIQSEIDKHGKQDETGGNLEGFGHRGYSIDRWFGHSRALAIRFSSAHHGVEAVAAAQRRIRVRFMINVEVAIVLCILLLGWFWSDSLRAREAGMNAVRDACAAEGLQWLDENIACVQMRIQRDRFGRLGLLRIYQFEFSDTGENRRLGSVQVQGQDVVFLSLGLRLVR